MKSLVIDETKSTPLISLDADTGIFSIVGNSYPENSNQFYQPVMKWLVEYFTKSRHQETVINIEIIYFNSSSSRFFYDFFMLLDKAKHSYKLTVNWIYDEENESAEEAGSDFIEDYKDLNIELVVK